MMKWGLGLVGLAVAGFIAYTALGLGGAAAQSPTPTPRDQQDEEDADHNWGQRHQELLAEELGISVDELKEARRSAWEKLIDERVAAGDIDAERGEELKEMKPGKGPGSAFGKGPSPGRPGGIHVRTGPFEVFETVAEVLGTSKDELHERLSDGESVLDIAKAQGISEDQLKSKLESAFTDKINQAVTDGDIDQGTANELLKHLDDLIDFGIDAQLPFSGELREHMPDLKGLWEGGIFHN
jgi:hypothetical protein